MRTFVLQLFTLMVMRVMAQPAQMEVAYGPDPLQRLDYTTAINPGSPILMMVHGGGWASGDKANPTFTYVAQLFRSAGYAVVSINYRLSNQPGYPGHPAIPSDVACAVAWTKLNAGLMNGDSSKVFMYGQSAGGHLVMLHGLTHPPSRLSACGYSAGLNVAGVIAANPALNFEHINPARYADLKPMVGDSATYWKDAAPAHNLSNGNKTKFMVQIGLNDQFLGTQQAIVFRDSMLKYDYCERFLFLPGHDHNSPLNNLSPTDSVFHAMLAFADSLFKNQLCAGISGEQEKTFKPGLTVYPNPTRGELFIGGTGEPALAEVKVYDMVGLLRSSGTAAVGIDLSRFGPGVFWVCVTESGRDSWHKIVVQ
jgi:acetyl esterase/lipase